MNPRRRASALRALAIAIALVVSGGCSRAPRGTDVVFWQPWPPAVVRPLIERWERANPGMRVSVTQVDVASLAAAVDSGRVPDLCAVDAAAMPALLQGGRLSDWSAGIADLRPALRGWELCTIGDAAYGAPWLLETRVLYYDKRLFARAGLDSARGPATWQALAAAAERVHALPGAPAGFGAPADSEAAFEAFMPLAWSNGGAVLAEDHEHSAFDSPRVRAALDLWVALARAGVVAPAAELGSAFAAGRLGMTIAGPQLAASLAAAPAERWGVAPVPAAAPDSDAGESFVTGTVLVGFTASRNKQAALELARFLVDPENALALSQASGGGLPATAGAESTAAFRTRPGAQVMLRQLDAVHGLASHPRAGAMARAIGAEVTAAAARRKPADAAVAAADSAIERLARR